MNITIIVSLNISKVIQYSLINVSKVETKQNTPALKQNTPALRYKIYSQAWKKPNANKRKKEYGYWICLGNTEVIKFYKL